MKIIVDTSVWSLFLRWRDHSDSPALVILRSAIKAKNVQMLGIVRQQLLSGIQTEPHFLKLEKILESFPDLLTESADHTQAAKFFNTCRQKGIQGTPVDFLICAQSYTGMGWQYSLMKEIS